MNEYKDQSRAVFFSYLAILVYETCTLLLASSNLHLFRYFAKYTTHLEAWTCLSFAWTIIYHASFDQFVVPVSCWLVRPVPCILLLDLFHSSQGDIFFVEAPGLSSRFDGKVKRNLGDLEFEERLEAVRRYEYVFA